MAVFGAALSVAPLMPVVAVASTDAEAPGAKGSEQPPLLQTLGALPGDLDTSFGNGGRATIAVDPAPTLEDHGIIVAPRTNGGYLVYGYLPPTGDIAVTAITSAGAVDTSFGVNGRVVYDRQFLTVEAATIDAAGRVLIVGNSREPGSPSGDFDPYLCRFLATGQPDTAFGGSSACVLHPVDIIANGADYATAVTTDGGSIYVAGQMQRDTLDDYDFLVLRLRASDGGLVTTFDGDGMLFIPFDVNSVAPGGDTDGALAIARDGDTGLYIAGYADNDGDYDNDWVIAKVDIFSGSYATAFCSNTTDCPGSERLGGRRHLPTITTFGENNEQVQGLVFSADGNLVVAVQKHLEINGNPTQVIETIKINPTSGASIAGQSDVRILLPYTSLGDIALDAAGNVLLSGVSSQNQGLFGADPGRVMFVSRLTPTLDGDISFTTFLGAGSASTLIDFPRASGSNLVDHRSEEMVLDASQRIVVAGSRLWRRDVPGNVFDYDHALFRLYGGAAPLGPNIFANGFE
jgi:uncharacterized delta-60 repeat protein